MRGRCNIQRRTAKRSTRRLLAAVAAVNAVALVTAGSALAHHSVAAVYKGTTAGGGTVEFRVNGGGNYVDGFKVEDVPTSCGTLDAPSAIGSGDEIANHAFAHTWGSVRYEGSFPARGRAQGTVASYSISGCKSAPVAWTATTDVPPSACGDGLDNDGDGRTDGGDPGCAVLADNDETDIWTGPECPWAPGCNSGEESNRAAPATRPVLSALTVDRRARRISYRLSEAANVRFTFERVTRGRRVGGRCLKPRRSNRAARRCSRYVAIRGVLSQVGARGRNSLSFGRRVGTTRLRFGRYRLTAVPSDGAGHAGATVRMHFRIAR